MTNTPGTPTQSRHPRRAVIRTVFAGVVGFAPVFPLIVEASGVPETAPGVAAGLAISGAITRIMAVPAVNAWLGRFLPWLAAEPQG